uniref:Palmitoyltransferase n=1 Tax=Heliothis virescens TaxID=7102 RepID=A0A2A4J965_HELVI
MASRRVTRKWEVFAGRNRFWCDGRLMTAPHPGVFALTLALICGTCALHFAFDCPFLAARVSAAVPAAGAALSKGSFLHPCVLIRTRTPAAKTPAPTAALLCGPPPPRRLCSRPAFSDRCGVRRPRPAPHSPRVAHSKTCACRRGVFTVDVKDELPPTLVRALSAPRRPRPPRQPAAPRRWPASLHQKPVRGGNEPSLDLTPCRSGTPEPRRARARPRPRARAPSRRPRPPADAARRACAMLHDTTNDRRRAGPGQPDAAAPGGRAGARGARAWRRSGSDARCGRRGRAGGAARAGPAPSH